MFSKGGSMQRVVKLFLWGGIFFFVGNQVFAQTGKIQGKISDERGAAVPFANILIAGTHIGAAADAEGFYIINDAPVGTDTLRVTAVGYKTATAEVTITAGQTASKNFQLSSDVLNMHEVVVTGTASPIPKLESSVAISTLSPKELQQASPRSTTEALRYVPGFTRIESSGGEVNENYSMRGIYGVELMMFMEDGLPVFPTMHTYFMNADNLFRMDDNIDHLEIVRGGNSALFGSNTPAAVINIINKTGGPEMQGDSRVTVGTNGLARVDYNVNGPLSEDWRMNVGGFYRYDHGIRDPGYTGIKGGQIKANITRLLDNGYIRISGKYINDHNQFILDLPHDNPNNPTEYVPGFSNYGSFNSPEGLNVTVPTPNGTLQLPLSNGIMTDAGWLTGDVNFNFGDGWNLRNQIQVMSDHEEWNAIVPYNAETAAQFTSSEIQTLINGGYISKADSAAAVNSAATILTYTNQFYYDSLGTHNYVFPSLSPNGLVAPGGEWHVAKPLTAFQEQLQVKKSFGPHDVSVGLYFADYTQVNNWYFTDILTDVQDKTHFLDATVTYNDRFGIPHAIPVTNHGFMHYISNYTNGTGETTIFSAVLSDQVQITDRLRLDLAGRLETDNYVQSSENTSNVQPDGTPVTAATPSYAVEIWGNNSWRQFNTSLHDWALSAGLNYQIVKDELSVYAQWGRAYKMPALDQLLQASTQGVVNAFEDEHTMNVEGGVKYSSSSFAYTLDAFYGRLRDISTQGAVLDPTTGRTVWIAQFSPENQSYGLEGEITTKPSSIPGLTLFANGTLLRATYASGADLGSLLNGIPSFVGNAVASYTWMNATLDADFHFVGNRIGGTGNYINSAGQTIYFAGTPLPSYHYLNLGLSYAAGQGVTLSLNLLNVYQSLGLEEGNPRAGAAGNYFLARPILPRRLTFSAGYQF